MLANIFHTGQGRAAMQDLERGRTLAEFCSRSFSSCNPKVVFYAAIVFFNYLLCFEKDSKKDLQSQLEQAFKSIDEALSNETQTVADKDTVLSLLLCECRILYKNHEMVTWVEEQFKLFFKETHNELDNRTSHPEIKQAVADLFSMVQLDSQ